MPEWLVGVITALMVLALSSVSWVWVQTFRDYRLVGEDGLKDFARTKLRKVSWLWIAQSTLAAIGLLSFIPDRPTVVRVITSLGFVTLALAVARLSFSEFFDLRNEMKRAEGSDPQPG